MPFEVTPINGGDTIAARPSDAVAKPLVDSEQGASATRAAGGENVGETRQSADSKPDPSSAPRPVTWRNLADESDSHTVSLLEVGERIGPYEVQAHLGDGGMASVYRVWHTGLHRLEALKVPRQQGRYGPEAAYLRRLLSEARTAANLHHPHIAAVHTITEPDAPLQFFSMEFIEGGDLANLLEGRRLTPKQMVTILAQIADALDYAHAHNVIHRDIKPANILIKRESDGDEVPWQAKVVDFGISRAGEDSGDTRLTRSGMIVGTPEYMSPEQCGSGAPVTYRTDIYSLGCIAYEMLAGSPPFTAGEGVSRLSLLTKHTEARPAPLTRFVADLPRTVNAIVMQALAKKPEDRFNSCGEFVAALSKALQIDSAYFRDRSTVAGPRTAANREAPETRSLVSAADSTSLFTPIGLSGGGLRRSRNTTLLAGLGGLIVGISIVFGWMGFADHSLRAPEPPARLVSTRTPPGMIANDSNPIPPNIGAPTAKPNPQKTPEETKPTAKAKVTSAPEVEAQPLRVVPVTRLRPIAFSYQRKPDADLRKGQRRVVQAGKAGSREVQLAITYRGEKEVTRRIVATRIVTTPVPQIEAVGTAAPPKPRRVEPARKASPRKRATPKRKVAPRRSPRRSNPYAGYRGVPLPP